MEINPHTDGQLVFNQFSRWKNNLFNKWCWDKWVCQQKSYSQSYGFPVVMNGCESWMINKAEDQRTDVFKLWCWRRALESPLDCKEIKPVNPKGTQPWILIGTTDAKAEAPVLWLPDAKSQLLENTLMMGKIEGRRIRGWQKMRRLDDITDSMGVSLSKFW